MVLALSFLGMVETLYLSIQRDSGPVPCHITNGCGDVLTSAYSAVGGIPISWFGFAFYLTIFGATVFDVFGGVDTFRRLRAPATVALVVSAVLTGIQAFVLDAYCEYCLGSAALSTAIWALVWFGGGARGPRRDPAPGDPDNSAPAGEKV